MIKRIVDISEQAYLHLLHQQLLIDKKGKTVAQIPVELGRTSFATSGYRADASGGHHMFS